MGDPLSVLEEYFSTRRDFPVPSVLGKLGRGRSPLEPGEPSSRLVFLSTVGLALEAVSPPGRRALEAYCFLQEVETLATRRSQDLGRLADWTSNSPERTWARGLAIHWGAIQGEAESYRKRLESSLTFRDALSCFAHSLDTVQNSPDNQT